MDVEERKLAGSPWDAALRYLGQRAHSQCELEQKLRRRGFSAEEVEQTTERLDQAGLIDDEQFAVEYARSLFEFKRVSSRQVAQKLRQRGVETEIINRVVEGSEDQDFARALELARCRRSRLEQLDSQVARHRLLAFLGRRGFTEDVCFAATRCVFDKEQNERY